MKIRVHVKLAVICESKESELWVMIGGIGGNTPAILTIIDSIQVAGAENRFIPTFVSRSIAPNFEGLIGMDFMANYSVRINTKNRTVIFEERPGESDMPAGHDEAWWRTTFSQFKSIRTAWDEYPQRLSRYGSYTDSQKMMQSFAEKQYERADELYNRLSGFAGEHSVPLQWR